MLPISFKIFIISALLRETTAACYYPNGTETNPSYSPCSNNTSSPLSTVCCASWDTCLPNGLCQSLNKVIYREYCTKKNWDEGGCQEMCSKERESQRNDNIIVTPCDGNMNSTTWCCGEKNDGCCTDGSGLTRYTLAARFGDPIPTSSASSSIGSPSASATNAAPSASSSTGNTGNGGLSTGAKAGVGVGAALGAIALIALGVFIYKALQWRKRARAAAPPYSHPEEHAPVEVHRYQPEVKPVQLPGIESEVHEMPGSRRATDMGMESPNVAEVSGVSRP